MAAITNTDNKRYQGLIISIAVFLTLIGVLLAFTFYTSSLLQRNTVIIDRTNQIANSTQSIIKDLFDLDNSYGESVSSPHMQMVLQRVGDESEFISNAFASIQQGLTPADRNGREYDLPNITDSAQESVAQSFEQWQLLEPKIQTYLEGADNILVDSEDSLTQAVEQAKTSSLFMNESLNELTGAVFDKAEQQANTIRLIQAFGVAAILVYFSIFILVFLRRLRETDAEALAARRETQEIMQTVDTGLFLLDKDLNIGEQHSRALNNIIGTDSLAGENFTSILRGRISDKDLTTTKQFIEQLYNPRVKEKLVDSLNPLHKVMLHSGSGSQDSENRFLDFKFSRVYDNKDIARILVNVNDVSDAVYLEQRLEKERSQNDMQIEMLTTILNVNPKVINEFIDNTKKNIEKINNILKNPGSSQFELEGKLKAIYRDMHSLKGESSALKLHSFTKIASDAEDKLQALQNQGVLSGNDFLPLAVHLDDLLSLSNTIEALGERINRSAPTTQHATSYTNTIDQDVKDEHISSHVSAQSMPVENMEESVSIDLSDDSDEDYAAYYQDFAQEIAQRQDKQVHLNSHTLTNVRVPNRLERPVKEITIQLLRNAIVHGVETPVDRASAGKAAAGNINLDMQSRGSEFVITIQDDGQGIDYDRIRNKLVENGRFDVQAVQQLNRSALLKELFSSGFSTKDDADEDGGRGVGLDIIKALVKEHDGHLDVNSELGKMTRFVIRLPKAS